MPRVNIKKKDQIRFLSDIKGKCKTNWSGLAGLLDVHYRCLSDWKQGKYTLPESIFKKCIRLTKGKIKVPPYKILSDFWNIEKAAKKGGLATAQKYGGPGTLEGRKKGGRISQIRRKLNPEIYQHCNIRKNIYKPKESSKLAELFGIILGDGGITERQVTITLNRESDKDYVFYVCDLIRELFKIKPAVYKFNSFRHRGVTKIVISSVNLVDFLLSKGLKKGSKVKQQVNIPRWVRDKISFSKNCLCGLMDTDGCVYIHRHKNQNYRSINIGMQFSNRSIPILSFVKKTLSSMDFSPKTSAFGVNLYRELEIFRYAKEIKFNNPRNSRKIKDFLRIKYNISKI